MGILTAAPALEDGAGSLQLKDTGRDRCILTERWSHHRGYRSLLGNESRMGLPRIKTHLGFPGSSVGKESTCKAGDLGSIPGLRRSPGEGKGYPFQYSGLENATGYIVHGVAKSRTRLGDFHTLTVGSLVVACVISFPNHRGKPVPCIRSSES